MSLISQRGQAANTRCAYRRYAHLLLAISLPKAITTKLHTFYERQVPTTEHPSYLAHASHNQSRTPVALVHSVLPRQFNSIHLADHVISRHDHT
eukprot:942808-Rhodomonas_salina.2